MGAATGVASGLMSAYSNFQRTMADMDEADYEAATNEKNAQMAGFAAQGARERGSAQEFASRLKYGALRGQQVSAYGAAGVTVNKGSALDALANTDAMSEYDAAVIRDTTAREVWGHKEQAKQFRENANIARRRKGQAETGGWLRATGSLLSAVSGGGFGGLKGEG